ncbi:DUF1648 domain-containing protein [candidate division WOR-3 bacterium]|nr:DUF1648 domain-containing protein [candidate division WOR-3 bacterium]
MNKKLGDCYPVWIELVVISLVFWSFCLVITAYPDLPDKIPTHFNARGEPDGWSSKTWINLLILPIGQIGLYVLMTIGAWIITRSKNPIRFINLPVSTNRLQILNGPETEEIRKVTRRGLLAIKIIVLGMFTYIEHFTIKVALGVEKGLSYWIWLYIVFIFAVTGWMTLNIYRTIWKAENKIS